MRPTIPLAQWKIAIDLAATHDVQNQPGTPAFQCSCKWCENWSRAWSSVLPNELREQLQRLSIDIGHPTDLYAFEEIANGAHCRVIYHVVGKLLSGPDAWRQDPKLGKMLIYNMLRESPKPLGLVVVPSRQTADAHPKLKGQSDSEILQVDLRLLVPLSTTPNSSPQASSQ